MSLKFEVVKRVSTDGKDFVNFWRKQYFYDLEYLYDENIEKLPLDENAVWALFKWKNGTEEIAQKKKQSIIRVYLPQLKKLPTLKSLQDGKNYLVCLHGGAIWDIFWLHCSNPRLFPIFDQHTYRSMAKISGMTLGEIPSTRSEKIRSYFEEYIPFTKQFRNASLRDLDRALFAYGRFLKRGLSGRYIEF